MSEFKGTNGPWHVSGKTVYAIGGDGSNRFSALVDDARTSERELEANARLIAAAPEMLDALKPFAACAEDLDGYPEDLVEPVDDDEWVTLRLTAEDYRRARAAIDMALGEEEK